MIQFNLLPDVKIEFIKAQRSKRTIFSVSTIVIGVSLALLFIMISTVYGVQKHSLSQSEKDIKNLSQDLKNTQDIDKILTVQNQLYTLVGLHQSKPVSSRVFTYVQQLTPEKAKIGDLSIDFGINTMIIQGTADSDHTVNQMVDSLKFATYTLDDNTKDTFKAFVSVVLTDTKRDDKIATYTITAVYDPLLFDNTHTVSLILPEGITSRSKLLFDGNIGLPKPDATKTQGEQQ